MYQPEEEAYKFCPKCGGKLSKEKIIDHLKCQACQFEFFLNPRPACVAIIFDDENRLLMTQRAGDKLKGFWDLPGGFVNKSEGLEDALKRELKEELNVDIEVGDYFCCEVDDYYYKGLISGSLDLSFFCKIKGEVKAGDDVADYKLFSLDELPEKITPHHRKLVDRLIEHGKLKQKSRV